MKIDLPSISEQKIAVFQASVKAGIKQMQENLKAPVINPPLGIDESKYSRAHMLRKNEGWEAPDPYLVAAYFRHFQDHFPEHDTDGKLAILLGLSSKKGSGDRRIRCFKEGSEKVPYGVWREFLIITGRVPQDVISVLAVVG